jgi:hypothetical protein
MKKLSKYIAFAFLGMAMASCGDDYNDWANPQTNPQEDAITIPGLTATAADAIDLANVSEDSARVRKVDIVTCNSWSIEYKLRWSGDGWIVVTIVGTSSEHYQSHHQQ